MQKILLLNDFKKIKAIANLIVTNYNVCMLLKSLHVLILKDVEEEV